MTAKLLDYYKALENGGLKMLEAALAQNWDEVIRFESACAVLIERLRECALTHELEPMQRQEKNNIMRRILHIDAQIRLLAEPWLEQADVADFHPPRPLLH